MCSSPAGGASCLLVESDATLTLITKVNLFFSYFVIDGTDRVEGKSVNGWPDHRIKTLILRGKIVRYLHIF